MAHHYVASQEVSDTRFDPEGPQLIIDTNYPMEPPENLSVSQAGELLIAFQGVDATPRESVHRILGPPRVASESESIWMYKSITDVNRDWKPHAEMEVLVIRFDPNGLAKDVETDFKTLMKMAEELKNTPTPGE